MERHKCAGLVGTRTVSGVYVHVFTFHGPASSHAGGEISFSSDVTVRRMCLSSAEQQFSKAEQEHQLFIVLPFALPGARVSCSFLCARSGTTVTRDRVCARTSFLRVNRSGECSLVKKGYLWGIPICRNSSTVVEGFARSKGAELTTPRSKLKFCPKWLLWNSYLR